MSELGDLLQAFRDGWRIQGVQRQGGRAYWVLACGNSPNMDLLPVPKGWTVP